MLKIQNIVLICLLWYFSNEEPIVKTRFVDYRSGQMVLRWDEHDICKPVNREPLSRLLNNKWRNPDGQKGSINFDRNYYIRLL